MLPDKFILVCLHPNTLGGDTRHEVQQLDSALRQLPAEIGVVLIGPNADAGADHVRGVLKELASQRPLTVYHDTLPGEIYLSAMKHCDVMVGNSSAGLYEAPCLGTPVLNLGDRQKGRPQWERVWNREFDAPEIVFAIMSIMAIRLTEPYSNPYGDGHASERIAAVIGAIGNPKALLRKKFNDGVL